MRTRALSKRYFGRGAGNMAEYDAMNRVVAVVALMLVAVAAWGQAVTPSAPLNGGRHRPWENTPQFQACKQQADDQKLTEGPVRQAFMKNCLAAADKRDDGSMG